MKYHICSWSFDSQITTDYSDEITIKDPLMEYVPQMTYNCICDFLSDAEKDCMQLCDVHEKYKDGKHLLTITGQVIEAWSGDDFSGVLRISKLPAKITVKYGELKYVYHRTYHASDGWVYIAEE